MVEPLEVRIYLSIVEEEEDSGTLDIP